MICSRSNLALVLAVALAACDRPTPPPPAQAAPSTTTAAATVAPQLAPVASASGESTPAADAGGTTRLTFDAEPEGAMPSALEPVVGDWTIGVAEGAKGVMVDGSKWRSGTPSVNLADQAKRLYGDRYAEFLDGVKAFAFYPLAVARANAPTGDVRLSVRFYPIAGSVDQAAGIAFGIAPDGTYSGVRANALEDNLLYFTIVKGKRTIHDTVRAVSTSSRAWHTLVVELRGTNLTVNVDGAKRFEKKLDAVPRGRVGLWSKADSKVLFDDFEIAPL